MNKHKTLIRIAAISAMFFGFFGLYFLEYYWITDKSFRSTVGALGSHSDVTESWLIVFGSILLLLIGLIVLIFSFRLKTKKK